MDENTVSRLLSTKVNISGQKTVTLGSLNVPAEQDFVTNSFSMIGHPHEEIHEGNAYIVSQIARDLSSGAFLGYLFTTSSKVDHLLVSVNPTAGSVVRLYENPTIVSGGTALTTINHHRISGVTSVTTVFESGGYTSGTGTVLQIEQIGSVGGGGGPGALAARFGGSNSADRNENEWVVKTSSTVLVEVHTLTSGPNDVSTQFRWYEENV